MEIAYVIVALVAFVGSLTISMYMTIRQFTSSDT